MEGDSDSTINFNSGVDSRRNPVVVHRLLLVVISAMYHRI